MLPSAPRLCAVFISPDSFWGHRRRINRTVTIPAQLRLLRETGRIAALTGAFTGVGHRFWDSDCGKWLEAAWSELAGGGEDPGIRQGAQEVQAALAAAQEPDGYLQSHVRHDRHANGTWWSGDGKRWQNMLENHELYSMGHLIEAFCAQHENDLGGEGLAMARRMLDLFWREFGPEGRPWWCGHPQIELALMRLFRATGDDRARLLAARMIRERGPTGMIESELRELKRRPQDWWFWNLERPWSYLQAAGPYHEAQELEGHAVRALYLAIGATDLVLAGDTTWEQTVLRLWDSGVHRRMQVTGGMGAHPEGERMGQDYDLPDERAYCETCASIALARWARRLLDRRLEAEYGDVMELTLHNAVLSGVSLDGARYFYSNPTATHPHDTRDQENLRRDRIPWFGCVCCPPNLARTISQIGAFAYAVGPGSCTLHLYLTGEITHEDLRLQVRSGLPLTGEITVTVVAVAGEPRTLNLRIPSWTEAPTLRIGDEPVAITPGSYVTLRRIWTPGEVITLSLPMPVQRLSAHPLVRQAAGQVAIRRGPLIWCLEEADNGPALADRALPDDAVPEVQTDPPGPIPARLRFPGTRSAPGRYPLYGTQVPARIPTPLTFIPYFAWGNRGPGEMRVWIRREPGRA